MESKEIKILNGLVETALDVLFILDVINCSLSKDQIAALNYVASTHNNKKETCMLPYIGFQKSITDTLHFLLAKQLINCLSTPQGNLFSINKIGKALVSELKNERWADILVQDILYAKNANFDYNHLTNFLK